MSALHPSHYSSTLVPVKITPLPMSVLPPLFCIPYLRPVFGMVYMEIALFCQNLRACDY